MNIKLLATCTNILACPVKAEILEEKIIGGVIVPAETQRLLDKKNPLIELEVLAVGHQVVKVKAGDRLLYNKHHGEAIPWGDQQLLRITEDQVFAIIKEEAAAPVPAAIPLQPAPAPLTIEEVKAGLGMTAKPVDDASALPVEVAPGA